MNVFICLGLCMRVCLCLSPRMCQRFCSLVSFSEKCGGALLILLQTFQMSSFEVMVAAPPAQLFPPPPPPPPPSLLSPPPQHHSTMLPLSPALTRMSVSTAYQLPAVSPSTPLSPWQLYPHIHTHTHIQSVIEVRWGYSMERRVNCCSSSDLVQKQNKC